MLPIGSIVYLKEGNRKIMVLNRGAMLEQADEQVIFDYSGCIYPVGWAIGIGVGAGFIASYLYNSNFMGMKSTAQSIGKNIDQTLSNIGKTFSNVGDFLWGN